VLQDPAEAKARRLRLTTTGKFDIGELLYLSWREIQYLAPFQGNLDLSVFLPGVTGSGENERRCCHQGSSNLSYAWTVHKLLYFLVIFTRAITDFISKART
jgi:hypothetical protein